MKTMNHVSGSFKLVVVFWMFTFLSSCTEESVEAISEQEEVEIANQSSSAENVTDEELQAIEEELAANPEGGRISGSVCAVVTHNKAQNTTTFDFGDGCVGPYGRERSGKIIITYGGEFGDHLANRIITFEDYYVNNKQITGSIELRDFNTDGSGQLTASRKRVNLTVHFPDGNSFTSNGSTTVTWLEGGTDENPNNDVLSITGSYEGVSTRGRKVTYTIIDPIRINVSCLTNGGFARVEGKTEMKIGNTSRERVRTVYYGDGTCDQTITVTVNNKIFTITLS